MPDRLLVLSDLHISPPGPLATFNAGPELAAFLHAHADGDTTLVLAGDILDLLQIEPRPPVLDMPRAPALIRAALAGISAAPWGPDLFSGFAAFLRARGAIVLFPGNHDPELFHPDTSALFLEAMGLTADDPGFTLHTADASWTTVIGGRPVRVGHGHRLDDWNDIDPQAVFRALQTGNSDLTLPPGSRLVLDLLNPLKRAVHDTGTARFTFLDLLKPERSTVTLLLPYLDWDLAKSKLGLLGILNVKKFLRRFDRALRRGKVLGSRAETAATGLEERLADAVAEDLGETARKAPEATMRSLELWLSGEAPVGPGKLAAHGGAVRGVARWYLQQVARDGSFFDPGALSDEDREVIARELPEGSGPRIAIFGHTHAARFCDFGDGRVYVNTGTWMDLMRLPKLIDDEVAVKTWIDRLEAGEVERIRRRTYAEVTADGPKLLEWPLMGPSG
jgi:UDP-2,3-diacylglucosamine pyrophosphatase LpxH